MKINILFVVAAMACAAPVSGAEYRWDANAAVAGQTDGDGNWLDPAQWWDGSTNATWSDTNAALIGSGGAGGTITVGATVNVSRLVFTNFTGTYTLSGGALTQTGGVDLAADAGAVTLETPLGGPGGVSKRNSGTLEFLGAHLFSGPIEAAAGTVRVASKSTTATLGGGAYDGAISLANGASLVVWTKGDQTLSGVISGGGRVEKGYNGTLVLSGSNTYTGATAITPQTTAGGAISVTSLNSVNGGVPLLPASSLGCPTTVVDGTITIGTGGKRASCTLVYEGPGETTDRIIKLAFNEQSKQSVDASGSGPLRFTSAFQVIPSSGNGSGGLVLQGSGAGEIAGGIPDMPGTVAKTGSGTWTFSAPNAYSQGTTISGGALLCVASNALGSGTVTVSGGTLELANEQSMSDTNRLSISGSGMVQLDAGIREQVGLLSLGGVDQAFGEWGSSASKAANTNDTYFSGKGLLYVGVVPPPPPPLGTVLLVQ